MQTSEEYDSDVRCVETNYPYYNPDSELLINKTYFDPGSYSGASIPAHKDWRDDGIVTEVKDQASPTEPKGQSSHCLLGKPNPSKRQSHLGGTSKINYNIWCHYVIRGEGIDAVCTLYCTIVLSFSCDVKGSKINYITMMLFFFQK